LNNAVSLGLRNSHFTWLSFFYFITNYNTCKYNLQWQGFQAFLCCEAHHLFLFLWNHPSIYMGGTFVVKKEKKIWKPLTQSTVLSHCLFTFRFHLPACVSLHSFSVQNASLPVLFLWLNYFTNHFRKFPLLFWFMALKYFFSSRALAQHVQRHWV
jgi:hypothetical protein